MQGQGCKTCKHVRFQQAACNRRPACPFRTCSINPRKRQAPLSEFTETQQHGIRQATAGMPEDLNAQGELYTSIRLSWIPQQLTNSTATPRLPVEVTGCSRHQSWPLVPDTNAATVASSITRIHARRMLLSPRDCHLQAESDKERNGKSQWQIENMEPS